MPTLFQINVTSNWGSTGKIAEQIGQKALAAGWDSYIAYGRMANPSVLRVVKVGNKASVLWHYVENRLFDNEGLASCMATRKLVNTIKAIHPDVVQLHNIHDHWLNYRILFSFLNSANISVFWTFHDCWAFTGHCPHFVTANCEKLKTECHNCELSNSVFDRCRRNYLLKRKLFTQNKNLHIITVSNWLKELVQQSFLKEKDIQVINNGIDLNSLSPLAKVNNEKFLILGVSSVWHQSKGLFDFYELRKLLPADVFAITLVGLTSQQILDLPSGITGMTRTNSVQELAELYSMADVLVNPTYADSFPTVNMEALACGTPVITYQTGGSPEIVDERTGVVVPQGDVRAIALAVQGLKQHSLSSEACRRRAQECFDKDRCFEKYISLYKKYIRS